MLSTTVNKNIARKSIDLNEDFNLRIIYIEFRQYLLRLNLNIRTRANIGTQFTPIDFFKYESPKIGGGVVSGL